MKDAIVFHETQPIVKNRAYGYRQEDNKYYCDYVEALTVGDGGNLCNDKRSLHIGSGALYR